MTAPFAAFEARANEAVMRQLSNARALKVGATEDFPVIFSHAFLETQVGVGATRPVAKALDTDVAGFESNVTQLVIGTPTYIVRDIQPDGTGLSLLVLEVH